MPLKFESLIDWAEQGRGGGGPQVRVDGEKLMLMVEDVSFFGLPANNVAVPEKVKLPASAGNEPVTVSVNVPESAAVKGIDPLTGSPLEPGATSIE